MPPCPDVRSDLLLNVLHNKQCRSAALAGMHPGDVINAVDGKPIKTPMELAAELSNHPTGDKVRIGYMLHGQWQTETVIVLP
jgi:S1-C subfamily serine protease